MRIILQRNSIARRCFGYDSPPMKVDRALRVQSATDSPAPLWWWLERVGIAVGVGVVIARATMLETVYEHQLPLPGQMPPPIGAGPASSITLSLLACVPGLIVLLRRAIDRTYILTRATTHVFMLGLGVWAVLSSTWAGDQFAAMVGSFTLFGALALIWGMAQLVRDWGRFRLVIGIVLGLLLVYCAQGIYYRAVELPELQQNWREDIGGFRTQVLKERGLIEGELGAERFGRKIMAGEMIGFTASPNSFAAILVMLAIMAAAIGIQRLRDNQGLGAIVPAVAIVIAGWMIYYTQSNTALITPVLAILLFAAVILLRAWMTRHRKLLFTLGITGILLLILAAVGHGLYHDSLLHPSLTFRWRYWVASARMFADHPLLGVGYGNFGNHYLAYRLPIAAEEIQDPHNLFVRFFTELGLIGGALAIAWEAARWWRLTRPTQPGESPIQTGGVIGPITGIVFVGLLLNTLASLDFSHSTDYTIWELFRRSIMFLLLLGGGLAVTMRSWDQPVCDQRPAPWLLYGAIIATAIFMVHSMLDFVFFESGPLYVFALITGAALGLRSLAPDAVQVKLPRAAWVTGALVTWLAWVVMMIAFALPTALAEDLMRRGDARVRAGQFDSALRRYQAAAEMWPSNPSYPQRAARAAQYAQAPISDIEPWLTAAIASNPYAPGLRRERARLRLEDPDRLEEALEDYAAAITLNPQEIALHLEYADVLERATRYAEAADHIDAALRINDAYQPDEIERLSSNRVAELQARLAFLREAAQTTPTPDLATE